jgi:ribose-phosphate pyrophosphokinase
MITLNGIDVTPTHFPDGTQQVWKLPDDAIYTASGPHEIYWRFDTEIELVTIMQLMTLIGNNVNLTIPYLPYGRQDKNVNNKHTFALHTFIDWLSYLNFKSIRVFDPHSSELLNTIVGTVINIDMPDIDYLACDFDCVCFPDAGAANRYTTNKPILIGEKVRDQSTGYITHYEIKYHDHVKSGAEILVIDDICDGGATFNILGKCLELYNFMPSLYISHGVFSRGSEGIRDLKKYYKRIITTDSVSGVSDYSQVEVIPCFQ